MRKALLLPLLLSTASFACSSSSTESTNDAGPAKDAGTPDHATVVVKDAAKDSPTTRRDTGTTTLDGSDDALSGDAGGPPPTPVGTSIEQSTGFLQIFGVTDDGYVIYLSNNTVKAAPEAGGTATTIVSAGEAGATNGIYGMVLHDNVFIWSGLDSNTFAGTLTVWSHTLGTPKVVSTTSYPLTAASSDDSTAIAFASGISTDGSSTDISGASMASLTTVKTLLSDVDKGSTNCGTGLTFSGTGTAAYVVVSGCTAATTDGGADGPEKVVSAPVATWTPAPLASGVASYSVDDTGTSVAVAFANGTVEVVPLAGGTPVTIGAASDAGASDAGTGLGSLYLSQKDSFVLYNTAAGALDYAKVTGGAPTTLLATGATDLDAFSASEAIGLVDTGFDTMTGGVTGLALTSTSAANKTSALVSGTAEAALFGDAFTVDSNYVLYVTGFTQDDVGNSVGTLMAAPIATPTSPVTVGKLSGTTNESFGSFGLFQYAGVASLSNNLLVLSQYGSGNISATDLALTGSKLAFSQNFNGDLGYAGQTDIAVVDLSTTAAATVVMKGADPLFAISPDKKYIIYTITFGGSTDGVYTVPVP